MKLVPAAKPLIDRSQMEEAGRTLRRLLDRLRAPHVVPSAASDTSIDWEDGEPKEEPGTPPAR